MTRPGRIGGIDYGTVRVGVAITDPRRTIASPLTVLHRQSPAADEQFFRRLVQEEEIVKFVVGLPVHTDGHESQKSHEARQYGKWLTEVTGLPVDYFDERYSSKAAEDFLMAGGLTNRQRKARIDMLAAQVMLEGYLAAGEKGNTEPGAIGD